MPVYEFLCEKCDFKFNHIMSIKDGEKMSKIKSSCPSCKSLKCVSKIPSAGSFIIKGYSEKNGYNKPSTSRK